MEKLLEDAGSWGSRWEGQGLREAPEWGKGLSQVHGEVSFGIGLRLPTE